MDNYVHNIGMYQEIGREGRLVLTNAKREVAGKHRLFLKTNSQALTEPFSTSKQKPKKKKNNAILGQQSWLYTLSPNTQSYHFL